MSSSRSKDMGLFFPGLEGGGGHGGDRGGLLAGSAPGGGSEEERRRGELKIKLFRPY